MSWAVCDRDKNIYFIIQIYSLTFAVCERIKMQTARQSQMTEASVEWRWRIYKEQATGEREERIQQWLTDKEELKYMMGLVDRKPVAD